MDTETFTKLVPIALNAITTHMVDHDLPAPMSIDVLPSEQVIRIRLIGGIEAQDSWVNSVCIDDEVNEVLDSPVLKVITGNAAGLRTAWSVRLPDSGVTFELVAYRQAPILTAVPA